MKRAKIILPLCTLALMLGLFSCNKANSPAQGKLPAQTATVRLTLGFSLGPKTMAGDAAASTAKPTTSWSGNIKDLIVCFVDNSGTISTARSVSADDMPTGNDAAEKPITFLEVKVNGITSGSVYVIANSQQSNISGIDPTHLAGAHLNDLLLQLVATTPDKPDYTISGTTDPEAGASFYQEPAEIFIAHKDGLNLANDHAVISGLTLTRMVSLLRVRIDQSHNGNNTVDFMNGYASLRVRRAGTSLGLDGIPAFADPRQNGVLFKKSNFNTTEPTEGYAGGTILDAAEHITLWQDYLIFPGGSETVAAEKFDVVLIGQAPAGYQPYGKTAAQKLTAPGRVAWTGAVSQKVDANGILDIVLRPESPGAWIDDPVTPGIPKPGEYANLSISVTLAPWGNITSQTIPL